MNEPNPIDDPFADSLRRMAPDVPLETKSRLLYECGMAAAETKLRRQRKKNLATAWVALLMASGTGFLFGSQFSFSNQSVVVNEKREIVGEPFVPGPTPQYFANRKMNSNTLAAAMPYSRVFELLDQNNKGDGKSDTDFPETRETPLGVFSFMNDLE